MSFLYPLGLLGLIAIPVLIIIYIIKNKYTEQVVSSTYLWTLSERFLKRKNPINRLTGIISLILQILAVILISFAIAHPVIALPGKAGDYCFVLDGSGSMNIVQNDKTRLELGKKNIAETIEKSVKGSTYCLVYVSDTTEIYKDLDDKDYAISLLDGFEPAYVATTSSDLAKAAQDYFNENSSADIYIYTDKQFESTQNVTVVNLAESVENYALSNVSYTLSGGKLYVSGNVTSYESSAELKIRMYINGGEEAKGGANVTVAKGESTPFTLSADDVDFYSLTVKIENSDSLADDNTVIVYNVNNDSAYKTLIVSDTPFFMQAMLTAHGNIQVDVISTDEYDGQSGYGLYVFDSFTPSEMPRDGAVWFFNPVSSTNNSGFSVQLEQELANFGKIEYNSSSSTKVSNLFADAVKGDIYIKKYVKCGLYRTFTTLFYYDGNPLLFAGTNMYGNREVVFAFDLHDTDFPLSIDYAILGNNLLDYTFPPIVDKTDFVCGDIAEINVLANCKDIRVVTPAGDAVYLDTSSDTASYTLTQVGTYTITLMVGNSARQVNLFSRLSEEESAPTVTEASFVLTGEKGTQTRDGRYDDLIILFIILAVIYIADWMVYCYEQYQLR